jgi:hypothetical protein
MDVLEALEDETLESHSRRYCIAQQRGKVPKPKGTSLEIGEAIFV